jgi:hypothetical protein
VSTTTERTAASAAERTAAADEPTAADETTAATVSTPASPAARERVSGGHRERKRFPVRPFQKILGINALIEARNPGSRSIGCGEMC